MKKTETASKLRSTSELPCADGLQDANGLSSADGSQGANRLFSAPGSASASAAFHEPAISRRRFAGILAAAAAAAVMAPALSWADDAAEASGTPGGGAPSGGGGSSTTTYDYSGTRSGTLEADGASVTATSSSYSATSADVNAALAMNAGTLVIDGKSFTKSGDDTNGDNCNFYGINSIACAADRENSSSSSSGTSKMYISNSTLSATSQGSNGLFSLDSAYIYAYNDTISTTSSNSRGLDATYDGYIIADSLDITTQADHCAAIASDRGGGHISITNSTLSTAGSGSPLVYSTGDLELDNCTGTATGSQICGMEGLNTILVYNSDLSSTNDAISGSDPIKNGIILYQSTSGDADTSSGSNTFEAVDSTLSTSISSGAFFYITNTTINVLLSGTTLGFDSDNVELIRCAGNDSNNWGSAGSNGGTLAFTAIGETLAGDIAVDTISSITAYLTSSTSYTGTTSIEANSSGSTVASPLVMGIDGTSKWVVTGNSTVSTLNVASGGKVVDSSGNACTIVANGTTVVSGSNTTVTCASYNGSASVSGKSAYTSYIDRTAFDSYYATSTTFGSNGTTTLGWTRLAGNTRYDTMAAISQEAFPEGASTVVVTTGEAFPDALAACGLAGALGAPILLTSSSALSSQASTEISRLGATTAYIIGGTSAVGSAVESSIKSLVGTTKRIYGADRYATALAIYQAGSSWGDTAFVASGTSFADALAISPYAYRAKAPIFLAGEDCTLDDSTIAAIASGGFSNIVLLGGTTRVSDDVKTQLGSPYTYLRLAGDNRYETCSAIADWCTGNASSPAVSPKTAALLSYSTVAVATGEDFPDALAGSALCGSVGAVFLLVYGSSTGLVCVNSNIADNCDENTAGYVFGGTNAVSTAVAKKIAAALASS